MVVSHLFDNLRFLTIHRLAIKIFFESGLGGRIMQGVSRRTFLGASASALAVVQYPAMALADVACVTGPLPGFLPTRLTIDCASRRNFALFRKNPDHMGLAGVVSMSVAVGKWGTYQAGNLFLFPWLKPKGQAFGPAKDWGAVLPTNDTTVMSAAPIGGSALPQDEYFCRVTLQVPLANFIGFTVDKPYGTDEAKRAWFSNLDKLADGKGVGIDWTSQNLNHPWFGGSRWIPNQDQCGGNAWRKLIADGVGRAAAAAC
jgi:hypothetical protein